MDIEMARSELIETRRDLQVSEMLYKRTPKVIESLINENQFKKVKCESRPPNLPSVPPPTQLQSFLPHSTHSNIKTVVSKHNIKDFSSHQDNTYLNGSSASFYCDLCKIDIESVEEMIDHVKKDHKDLLDSV